MKNLVIALSIVLAAGSYAKTSPLEKAVIGVQKANERLVKERAKRQERLEKMRERYEHALERFSIAKENLEQAEYEAKQ